jgi:hypothetical protein
VHMPTAMEDLANDMESAVVVLCVALLLWAMLRADRTRRARDVFLLGAACGLLVLARLDFALVVWIPPLVAWWRLRSWRVPLLSAAGFAVVAGPYFVWNRLAFGHWLSVSGTVKQAMVSNYVDAHFGGRFSWGYLHFVDTLLDGVGSIFWRVATFTSADGVAQTVVGDVLAVACLVGLVMLGRRLRREGLHGERGAVVVVLGAGVLMLALKTVVDAVFSPFWVASWYAAAQRIAFTMAVGVLVWTATEPLRRRLVRAPWLPAAVIGLVFVPLNLSNLGGPAHVPVEGTLWPGADLQAVDWISSSGPPGRYGSTDAGVLGFYVDDGGHASMSDLDGLAASYAYADALLGGVPALQRYRMLGLDFLVARRQPGSGDVPACAPVIWTSPQGVVYGGGLDQPQVTAVPLRVWDLRPCAAATALLSGP